MQKLVLLILLCIAAVVMVPALRERAKPILQPAMDPIYEWNAKNRVKEIANLVKRADALGRPLPPPADFARFVENEDTKANASIDPWGTPYYVLPSRTGFRVGSAGRDRQAGTTDDILTVEQPLKMKQAGRRRAGERR